MTICRSRREPLPGNKIGQHLDLGLPISRTVRNRLLWFKPYNLEYFVKAARADSYNHHFIEEVK